MKKINGAVGEMIMIYTKHNEDVNVLKGNNIFPRWSIGRHVMIMQLSHTSKNMLLV